jgi:hypothetical protein
MKLSHYALSSVLALGLLGGCGSYYGTYGTVGLADEPDGYYSLGFYDGPDYDFYRDGHYYYGRNHRDNDWRRVHERERIHLERGLHDRYAREWHESGARQAGHVERHEEHHDEHHDGHDHH